MTKVDYGLLSWFDTRINNALTEGFNTMIQALKATAKGYRNFENFRMVILFYCGKLDMSPDLVRVGAVLCGSVLSGRSALMA